MLLFPFQDSIYFEQLKNYVFEYDLLVDRLTMKVSCSFRFNTSFMIKRSLAADETLRS